MMISRIPALIALITLSAHFLPAGAQQQKAPALRPRLERMIRDTTLPNGLTVIVAESHVSPVTTVEVVVRTGAFTQAGGDEGISHLFEHVLFRAFGAGDKWGSELYKINAASNGYTSTENVGYYVITPAARTERAIELLSELVVDPKFRGGDIDDEMKIVVNEFERNASDATFLLRERSGRLLWGDAWSRKDPLGTPETIKTIKKERLREVYGRYYVPGNAAVVVSGDIDPAKAIFWINEHFGKWPAREVPTFADIAPVAPLKAPAVAAIAGPVDQVHLTVQWQGPSTKATPKDTYVADVFSDLLNMGISGFQSRLSGSGLFQSLDVEYDAQVHTGPISISGVTSQQHFDQAIETLRNEIARFDDPGYFTQEHLEIAKKRRAVRTEFGLERGSTLAHELGSTWSVAGLEYFLGYVDNTQSVTLADLQAYVAKYLSGKPFAAAALAPAGQLPKVEASLNNWFGKGVIQ